MPILGPFLLCRNRGKMKEKSLSGTMMIMTTPSLFSVELHNHGVDRVWNCKSVRHHWGLKDRGKSPPWRKPCFYKIRWVFDYCDFVWWVIVTLRLFDDVSKSLMRSKKTHLFCDLACWMILPTWMIELREGWLFWHQWWWWWCMT